MGVLRDPVKCPLCGERIKEIYQDQSEIPPMMRIIGDTFIKWDFEGHKCFKPVVKEEISPIIDIGRRSLPLTSQELWDMAKVIVDKQKSAKESTINIIDWDMIEGDWFDWLQGRLYGEDDN